MHLHDLVPVSLRGKIPEFLPGQKSILNVVQCAKRPALGDAPAGLIVFGRVASAEVLEERYEDNRALDPKIRLFNTYVRLIRA